MSEKCHMLRFPKVVIAYIYPLGGQAGFRGQASRFVDTYLKFPADMNHETVIVCNGVPANDDTHRLFSEMPSCSFLNHDNSGWDIGGFQMAARSVPCDMMVFFGSHTYFRQASWLIRMWEVFQEYGDTLYGATGNQGNMGCGVHPHVRTTGFWCSPSLLAAYPHVITQNSGGGGSQRYEAEHGDSCITNWVRRSGLHPWIVGRDCVLPLNKCDSMPNGYHQNDQSNVLVGDRLTCPPFFHHP